MAMMQCDVHWETHGHVTVRVMAVSSGQQNRQDRGCIPASELQAVALQQTLLHSFPGAA
jgi:hypothetical protein